MVMYYACIYSFRTPLPSRVVVSNTRRYLLGLCPELGMDAAGLGSASVKARMCPVRLTTLLGQIRLYNGHQGWHSQ